MNEARTKWNERWREKAGLPASPDPWLCEVLPLLPVGRALDLASGNGRNALLLAEGECLSRLSTSPRKPWRS